MKIIGPLIKGKFVARPNRFMTDIELSGEIVESHLPDPGRLLELLIPGTNVWLRPAPKNSDREHFRFLHVSTDEVYGSLKSGKASEEYAIWSSSPYSASKSSAEQIALSYYRTFKLPIIISRSSNNYGPYQFPEKLIPLSIINALNEKKINIYGNGLQIRNWIHVDDNNNAIIEIIKKGKLSNIYNIGHNNEITNIKIVKYICYILNEVLPRKNKKLCFIFENNSYFHIESYRY